MLVRALSCVFIASTVLAGSTASIESKLIGKWSIPVIDASSQITYYRDHTCRIRSNGLAGPVAVTAHWRVDGEDLITSYKGREARDRIVKLTATEFKFQDTLQGRVLTYTRLK